ncbi:MAG: heat-inducible transcription repressor HrcA [Clostridiales bacterium]|nr:heat-inducible transcription repressor HrcA [Clostridiales bacterium]
MNNRKLKILRAVIDEYILTGEPVGSKKIAMLPEINVSAATVRNDMAILEQLGLLEQPHTSAGRIPTFSGFKVYIDTISAEKRALSEEEKRRLDEMLNINSVHTEDVIIQNATTALAEITKCATVASNATPKFSIITKVEIIPTGKRLYVILLITSSGNVKNKACRLEFDLDQSQLEFFSRYVQENLHGVSVESLSDEMFQNLVTSLGAYIVTLSPLIEGIYELSKDLRNEEITLSGEKNLLNRDDLDKNEIIRFIENKNNVLSLIDKSFEGIKVIFSDEKDSFIIGNSSLIVSKYQKGDKEAGSLGIIGPMRLDYTKIIPYLEYFTQKITDLISEDDDYSRKDDNRSD